MSTQTVTPSAGVFKAAKVRLMPTLACIGYVDDVLDVKDTEKGVYFGVPFKLAGSAGSRGAQLTIYSRPEWYTPGFDPEKLKLVEDPDGDDPRFGEKLYSVYRMHINGEGNTFSYLKGLCGSEESFQRFAAKLVALHSSLAEPRDLTEQEIRDLMRDFFLNDNAGVTFGYELKQSRQKTDQTDENGKVVYELRDQYEVSAVVHYDEKVQKSWERRAQSGKSRAGFRIAFEAA